MDKNKITYIVIAVAVVAAFWWWWWSSRQARVEAPLDTSDINQELEGLDVNNLDAEFEEINKEIETL
ncbi:MAG TPA: hypothetical protein VJ046_03520 [Candidatus Paceibacterota bacterium]|nr:hypothetical protein [Candidatus Paceibacterota bacterium]